MENMLKTPPKVPNQTQTQTQAPEPECETPKTPVNSSNELRKPVTPDRLSVPKAFKYPERYTSPTDLMVSPVTKGLLARSKKGGGGGGAAAALLPPGKNQTKIPDTCLQDIGPLQTKVPMPTDEKLN